MKFENFCLFIRGSCILNCFEEGNYYCMHETENTCYIKAELASFFIHSVLSFFLLAKLSTDQALGRWTS